MITVPKHWHKTSLWKRVVHLLTDKKLIENPKRGQAKIQSPQEQMPSDYSLTLLPSWHLLPWRNSYSDGNTWVNNRDLNIGACGDILYSSHNASKSKESFFFISTCLGFLVCFVCRCLHKVSLCSPGRSRMHEDSPVGQVWPTKDNVSQSQHDQRKKHMPSRNITWDVAMLLECSGGSLAMAFEAHVC